MTNLSPAEKFINSGQDVFRVEKLASSELPQALKQLQSYRDYIEEHSHVGMKGSAEEKTRIEKAIAAIGDREKYKAAVLTADLGRNPVNSYHSVHSVETPYSVTKR